MQMLVDSRVNLKPIKILKTPCACASQGVEVALQSTGHSGFKPFQLSTFGLKPKHVLPLPCYAFSEEQTS